MIGLIACALITKANNLEVAELTKILDASGNSISASGALSREIVILERSGAADETVLHNIALVCDAAAQKVADKWRIYRDREMADKLKKKEQDIFRATMNRFSSLKALPTGRSNDEAARVATDVVASFHAFASGGARVDNSVLASQLMSTLLADPLCNAEVPLGQTRTFSNIPNRQQLPLWGAPREAIAFYDRIRLCLLDTMPAVAPVSQNAIENAFLSEAWGRLRGALAAPTWKVILAITNRDNQVTVRLSSYEANGKRTGYAAATLEKTVSKPSAMPDVKPAVIPLDEMGKVWTRLPKDIESASINTFQLSEEDADSICEVTKQDPLRHVVAKAIQGLRISLDLNHVAARVSDDLLLSEREFVKGNEIDLDRFCQSLMTEHTVEIRAGWLLVRPARSLVCERNRLSRPALQEFLQATRKTRSVTDAVTDRWFYENGFPVDRHRLPYWQALLVPLGVSKYTALSTSLQLAGDLRVFIGSLDPAARLTLEREGILRIGFLSLSPGSKAASLTALEGFLKPTIANGVSDLDTEPTEWIERFGTDGITVEITGGHVPAVALAAPEWSGAFRQPLPTVMSADEMSAVIGARIASGTFSDWREAMSGKWIVASRSDVDVSLTVAGMRATRSRPGIPTLSGEPKLASELPTQWQEAIENALRRDFGIGGMN